MRAGGRTFEAERPGDGTQQVNDAAFGVDGRPER
jgi:hypothetical protein